ncbi:putative RNA-directed DNA polymerase [Helianthus debilis subsp. tardiflorus]
MNCLSLNVRGIVGGVKAAWIREIRKSHNISVIALQETKVEKVSNACIASIWGNKNFEAACVASIGLSGGLIWIWDPKVLKISSIIHNRSFLIIKGTVIGSGDPINLVNIYAPQSTAAKLILWNELSNHINSAEGMWFLAGDFNAVRSAEERKRSSFKPVCANNFNNFIFNNDLVEYPMQGKKFTCIRDNGRKLSKLDRFLVSFDFFNKWPSACVRVLPSRFSDHCPIVLEVVDLKYGPRPFRIFSSWIGKPGFEEAVLSAVEGFSPTDPPDSSLTSKFALIRNGLKIWRDEFLAKEREDEAVALGELEQLEVEMESRDLSEEEEWILAENRKIIKEVELRRNSDLKQRACSKWAMEGDENTKFFHALVNNRKASNSIHGLNVGGQWCSKPSLIKKEIFSFFRNRFKDNIPSRPMLICENIKKISEADKTALVVPFSLFEIKEAVFECGDDRARGPDGMNLRFIKHFWEIFEDDFSRIFDRFYSSGHISAGSGSSFITLVPKVLDPVSLNNYRPINLVGVINKVISKVVANRIRRVLDGNISDSQSAFLSGRFILDGPLIINEIISWVKKQKSKAFFVKLDFEKAYDNVSWCFVLDILRQMGFPDIWCNWIAGILKSASSSVLVNGSPTFIFKCEKGVRKGDPLSPFLFLIVMEALSCMFDRAKEEGIIKGICTPNAGPIITHLLYADDALVMGEWSKEEVLNIVRILRFFHVCSGLKINIDKSNLYGIGVGVEESNELASVLGCKSDSLPFKYLGLKVGANMNRVSNWQPVFDIFRSRLAKWKSNLLSIGGRVVIIKSVLESLPTYYFSLYKAPKKVIADLEAMIKNFLWGGSSDVRKTHWVAWDRVARHKKEGGLGLNKLKEVNISLLAKWGWRYKSEKGNLWKRIIDAFHSSRKGWECIPFKKTLSGVWSNIAKVFINIKVGGSPLRNFIKGIVGNGKEISFWLDTWIIDRINPNGSVYSLKWAWKSTPSSPDLVNNLNQLISLLNDVQLSDQDDRWIWRSSSAGMFSVNSVKSLLTTDVQSDAPFVMKWCNWIPAKCNIHAWRMEMGKIPTGDALRRRNINIEDITCPMCSSTEESADHLFTSCYVASVVWNAISNWCRIPSIFAFSCRDLLEVHSNFRASDMKKDAVQGIIMIGCWSIWRARNQFKFSNKPIKIDCIVSEVKALSFLWFSNRSKYRGIDWEKWCSFVNM